MPADQDRRRIGLPARPFLYTLDQIATLLDVQIVTVRQTYIYYEGRTLGAKSRHVMLARNIAPENASPDWRVAEKELYRWFRVMGFRWYDRGMITD